MSILKCNVVLLSLMAVTNAAVNYNGISIKELSNDVMTLGEGPFWDSENNVLYFVDILKNRVYRYFQNGLLEHVQLDENVGFVIPVAGKQGLFAIGLGTTLSALRWNINEKIGHVVKLSQIDVDKPGNRWNDAKADQNGHLWAGTMGPEVAGKIPQNRGTLYKLNNKSSCSHLEPILPGVTISNGLAWSENGTKMYYIDSPTRQIALFDYNATTASLSNRTTLYDFKTDNIPGVPDGMTIDANDDLWIANYGGAQVLHVSGSSGKLLGKIKIAAEKVSSVTFGGSQLDKMYVTTISSGVKPENYKEFPMTGKVLEITGLGVKGTPNRRVSELCFKHL